MEWFSLKWCFPGWSWTFLCILLSKDRARKTTFHKHRKSCSALAQFCGSASQANCWGHVQFGMPIFIFWIHNLQVFGQSRFEVLRHSIKSSSPPKKYVKTTENFIYLLIYSITGSQYNSSTFPPSVARIWLLLNNCFCPICVSIFQTITGISNIQYTLFQHTQEPILITHCKTLLAHLDKMYPVEFYMHLSWELIAIV